MGRILQEDIETVKERNDIVDVVGDHVVLKKRGRLFWGLCPFHDEKTPSFKVDQESQMYHCFGCGQGGTVFNFLMDTEKMEFPEAVEVLADRVGVTLRRDETPGADQARSRNERLMNANDLASRFFEAMLVHEKYGDQARKYLADRGFTPDLIQKFRIGYAPARDSALQEALIKRGVERDDIETAGLARPHGNGLRDMFRGRVIFPILDLRERPVAFGGRVLGDGTPKYLNSPETPVYHKGSLLYGISLAKEAISREKRVIVVEGYTDVIALNAYGIDNVVGTLGTALTADHIKLMRRYTERINLLFDGDRAGLAAAERALGLGDSALHMKVTILPEGSDPADAVAEHGPDWLISRIESALPLLEFAIEAVVKRFDLSDTNEKLLAAKEAIKVLAAPTAGGGGRGPAVARFEADSFIGAECIKILSEKIGLEEKVVKYELTKEKKESARIEQTKRIRRANPPKAGGRKGEEYSPPGSQRSRPSTDPTQIAERELLKILLRWPDAKETIPNIVVEDFEDAVHIELMKVLKERGEGMKIANEAHGLSPELRKLVSSLMLETLPDDNIEKHLDSVEAKVRVLSLERKITIMKDSLAEMDAQQDPEMYNVRFGELIQLEKNKRELSARIIQIGTE